MRTLRLLCTLACALAAVALVVTTGEAAAKRHSTHRAGKTRATAHVTRVASKRVAHAPGSAGMVIAVDPETGALRMPTAQEMQALSTPAQDDLNQSDAGLTAVHHPNGMISIDLQGRFQDYAVARVGADGKLIFGCGKSPSSALGETYAPNRPSGELEVK